MVKKEESIYKQYFRQNDEFVEKYGENTILLMQVGSFFEMYGLRNDNKKIYMSKVEDVCNILDFTYSIKDITYDNGDHIIMAGFPEYTIDKYIDILVENDYTVPVIVQHKKGKTVTRELDIVYSKGTHLSVNSESSIQQTNTIGCIWLNTYKLSKNNPSEKIAIGMEYGLG